MKNIKFIVILAFAVTIGCGEAKVVELGSLQQRGGVYVVPETQKPYSGKFVESRGNVVIRAGSFKNGKLHGEITIYNKDGSIIGMVNYKDGIVQRGSFTDSRDGKKYATVKIGQTWMAENLNYDAEGSKCCENNPANCQTYGRLYDWNTALKACPSGWHLPNGDEWQKLVDIVGGDKTAGAILKAASGWNKNGNGTDEFGFSALPGGGGYSDGGFFDVDLGYWWSASEDNSGSAYRRRMFYYSDDADWSISLKSRLLSVRCVQD